MNRKAPGVMDQVHFTLASGDAELSRAFDHRVCRREGSGTLIAG